MSDQMKRIFIRFIFFLVLVSAMASYPAYKWGHNYLASCWIVARATAFPFLFVAIRIATERNPNDGLGVFLGILYYGSVLAIGYWFLGPLYPFPEVLTIMLFGLIPLI
ncbi:hypothetical protein KJ810_04305, partial [Patescibacteria group bacterium]|nr:hypothetical protein [Patescibacteria group bacterium]